MEEAGFVHPRFPMVSSPSAASTPFLLLFRNTGPDVHQHLTAEQRLELTKQWNDWYDGLAARGQAIQGSPLGFEGRVLSGPQGRKVIDGPYAEAKEVVGGFVMVRAADLDEATELAKGCPGLPLGLTVEVRPLVPVSPVLEGVQAHAP